MGEDDDEQTGNYIRYPPVNEYDKDMPKYKRQEFMKPKYGAVSFDVIDEVNARLAAVAGKNDLLDKLCIETCIENNDRPGEYEVKGEVKFRRPVSKIGPKHFLGVNVKKSLKIFFKIHFIQIILNFPKIEEAFWFKHLLNVDTKRISLVLAMLFNKKEQSLFAAFSIKNEIWG